MKRNEGEDKDGNRHKDEDEDGDLSCTTVLLLVSIADEEGGQDEAPTIPAIYHHHNHPLNLVDATLPLGEGRLSSRGCRTCDMMIINHFHQHHHHRRLYRHSDHHHHHDQNLFMMKVVEECDCSPYLPLSLSSSSA